MIRLCIVAASVANNILLKSYDAQSECSSDIPLSAFAVIIITIAREHGTAGKRIGQLMAAEGEGIRRGLLEKLHIYID